MQCADQRGQFLFGHILQFIDGEHKSIAVFLPRLDHAALAIENQAARRASVADTMQCYCRILDQRGTTSEFGRPSISAWRKGVSASIHKQVNAVYRFSVNSSDTNLR